MDTGHWEGLLRGIYGGRRWLVARDVATGALREAEQLRGMGAAGVMVVAASRGTGPLDSDLPMVVLDVRADTVMDGIHASERALEQLPDEAVAAVDRFDPAREARVLRSPFASDAAVAGRRAFGARPVRWRALEDKLIVDAVWDAVGAARAPSAIAHLDDAAALQRAHAALDRGLGTVWAGDNKSGWHGGATAIRRVRAGEDLAAARLELRARCDRVRVMPFLDGVPCSIHGMVFADRVVALRPCEMLVLRPREGRHLLYAAAATFWDPPADDREAMRDLARRTGAWLREAVGYRGVFTVDGVMTREGFLPTELNPRFGAAIGVMAGAMPSLALYLLHLAVAEGVDADWRPEALEACVLDTADRVRGGRVGVVVQGLRERAEIALVFEGASAREAREGEPVAAMARLGPAAAGTYVGVAFDPAENPVGPSLAPRAAGALAWLDRRFDLGLGPLEAAPDLRRSAGADLSAS